MKLSNLYLLSTVVAFIFALGLLLGPATILQMFHLSTTNTDKLLAQLFGASLAGFGLLSWFARGFTDQQGQNGAAITLFVFNLIAFIVSLLAVFSKVWGSAGWVAVVIFLLFALGFGYFQFVGPKE
jgi:hypothetical protein